VVLPIPSSFSRHQLVALQFIDGAQDRLLLQLGDGHDPASRVAYG